MSSNTAIAALEQKYIELLEKKISRLESEDVNTQSKNPSIVKKSSASSLKTANGENANSSNAKETTGIAISDEEPESYSRIRFRERKFNKDGLLEEKDVATKTAKPDESRSDSTKHAMTLLRTFNSLGNWDRSYITVQDKGLQAILLYALSHHPYYNHSTTLYFTSLFEPLIHNWSSLNLLADNDRSEPVVANLHRAVISAGLTSPLAPLKGPVGSLDKASADLRQLLDQVQETPGLERYFLGAREMQETAHTVAFDYLWTIFPPGEVVISRPCMGQLQAFIVRESTDVFERRSRSSLNREWELDCWTYDYNGSTFDRIPVTFTFEEYKGTNPISSLRCYPLKFHRQSAEEDGVTNDLDSEQSTIEALRGHLIKRGKKYRWLCLKDRGEQVFEYDGMALSRGTGVRKVAKTNQDDDSDAWSSSGRTSQSTKDVKNPAKKHLIKKDRVMVDFNSYLQHCPSSAEFPPMGELEFIEDDNGSCNCVTCMANDRLRDNQKLHYDSVKGNIDWEDIQYLICPPRVLGYHLKSKRWVELNVELVIPIQNLRDPASFQKLELQRTKKELIEQLVERHASGRDDKNRSMTDLMHGKGNGLVILLHGPPGVGKTLTAESVAAATGKPLFAVSVSDIGLKPAEVEHNLEVLFELAATWRAVMLFDEADVFLESRSSNTANLDRNALVSVLLRVLEYYDGILILTTNRIRTFDIAVQSRVNFAITFKNLDDKQKKTIYSNFIKQLNEDNTLNYQELIDWPESDDWNDEPQFRLLNGRQIRNVLFSAASIAQGDKRDKRLSLAHIKKILKETNSFQNDISTMYERARAEAEVAFEPH